MTPHGEDIQRIPEIEYGYRMNKRWDRMIRRNLCHADVVTALSESVKGDLDFVPEEKIFIVPNGIEAKQFSGEKSYFLHDLLFLNKKTKLVLSVGRNNVTKGYEYGIQAFEALSKMEASRDLAYVIIGKDTHALKPWVSRLALEDRVYLLPQKDSETVLKCYQSGWCFFSPSITECLSLVSIEAMGAGLPLVVTDVPGNTDIVRDNQCGIIVKNKDPFSMAKGILALISNQKLYERYSRAALERVHTYDWKNIGKKYLAVYETAIERCKKRTSRVML